MNEPDSPSPDAEVAALVDELRQLEARLAALTSDGARAGTGGAGHTVPQGQVLPPSPRAGQWAVLDALVAQVAVLDAQGRIVAVNAAWKRSAAAHGVEGEGLGVGHAYARVDGAAHRTGAAEAAAMAEGLRAVLAGEAPEFSFEYPSRSPSGQRWFRMTATPLDAASPAGAVVLHVDISDRVTAQHQLQKSQALVRLAGDMARLGAWSVEVPSMVVQWSDVVASIHDEPPGTAPELERAIGYYAPAHQDAIRSHFLQCAEAGVPFDLELQLVTGRGTRRWVRVIGQPERDEAGRIVRVQGAFQEISDRKAAEQATRDLAERLQDTLDSITDGVFAVDAQWRFTYVNRQAELLLQRQEHELLGRNIWTEFPDAVGSRAQREYTRAVRDGVSTSFEYHYPPLGRWFDVNAYPSAQGLTVYFHDITGRKTDQDALRLLNAELEARVLARTAELDKARHEAELASQAKSAFLAAMSHEIRTPMNGVVGMVDVLHQTSLQGYQVEMVDLIRESAYSLLGIIEDILDFSKIEAGRLEIERSPFSVADTVESVCGMLDHMAIKRDVRMALFVDPSIPSLLVGDEARMRQVLVNLIGNAIKFCGGREWPGRIAVRARLRASDAGSATVELSVSDNGIGMDEGTLQRLFRPFEQGDASTTRRFGGTGLGLAISGTLVQLMGGEITVRSAPGEGATFTVVLPLARTDAEQPADPAASLVAGLRCCIIGSDMPLAEDLAAYLHHAGIQVARTESADTARAADLWVLLPSQCESPLDALRVLARRAGEPRARFFKLGSGYRRRPRVEANDLVLLDHCGLTRRSLYRVLALASGRLAPDEASVGSVLLPQRSSAAAPQAVMSRGSRILVAEDNETNRKVIEQQLHLLGFDAEFAEDGLRALELWDTGDFALVLTDLHMPRMDGYALAAAIRREEQARGGRRTAIVALTANALRDEEARCRTAGMDAYLGKPVRLARLQATLEAWLPAAAGEVLRAGGVALPPHSDPPAPVAAPAVDLAVLKALVGDEAAIIARVLRAFKETTAESSAMLLQAFAVDDLRAVSAAAHKMKSGAQAIGALPLGQRCHDIEMAAAAGLREKVAALIGPFQADLQAVAQALEDH